MYYHMLHTCFYLKILILRISMFLFSTSKCLLSVWFQMVLQAVAITKEFSQPLTAHSM